MLALLSFLSTSNIVAAESRYECPPEIQTDQSLKDKAPDGFSSLRENQSRGWLDSLSVFDGPPQELASLVPDNEENQDIKKTIWTFKKKRSGQFGLPALT